MVCARFTMRKEEENTGRHAFGTALCGADLLKRHGGVNKRTRSHVPRRAVEVVVLGEGTPRLLALERICGADDPEEARGC